MKSINVKNKGSKWMSNVNFKSYNKKKETFIYYESLERECVEKLKKTRAQLNRLIALKVKILKSKSKKKGDE